MPRPSQRITRAARLAFNVAYSLLWCVAGPLVFLSPRMRQGWRQRLGLGRPAPCDLWIQGASAGECALVGSLLEHLPNVRVLATTCTSQGLGVLEAIQTPALQARYLPLDLPWLMKRMLDRTRPKAVVLLETEIWPGLLAACADRKVPVIVVNGRMSTRSLAGYLFLRPVLCPPERIGAIAGDDARRYGLVFGPERTAFTGNIKFDRAMATPLLKREDNPLARFIPENRPFLVLGSVREQEEKTVLELIRELLAGEPECVVGLFPRHMHRIDAWKERLSEAGIAHALRSGLKGAAEPGVVLWDTFGELSRAYALARRAFVGGSLARLGGQNFLEPLAQGVLPCVGPHNRNFDWVGREIFDGLVFRSADVAELARTLLSPTPSRSGVREKALAYVRARQGASAASVRLILPSLARSEHD